MNAFCFFFEHLKSGARVFKIAADDPNKTFCIAFKTFPESDNGAPHIMEHSVLNGSEGFPVKSHFDILLKGSLHTFLNAFTGKDLTMYPVASMNEKDYFNLMHVYLDAVFNPLIYKDDRILKQEGWHHELESPDGPVIYKGVVYNEMKGSFSNPVRELWYQIFQNLFPDNEYRFESGGTPAAIPTLTNEDFIGFHQKYYHPGNSYIFLYGDADLQQELQFIDGNYLSKYEQSDREITIAAQLPFASMKEVQGFYPVMEGSESANQTYLSLSFVAGNGSDRELTMALDILSELLVNQESAPIRLALQQAGIGQDVNASASIFQQNVFQIIVQNANPADKDRFYQIVRNCLEEITKNGVDKKELEGVLNRYEFQLREGNDAQKGMTYIEQSQPGFFFANDPFIGLEYESPLSMVKTALSTTYFENIIEIYLLNNPHALLLSMEPKPGLDVEQNLETEKSLKAFKENLGKEQLDALVDKTQELILYQQREDSPEAIASVPMLALADINPSSPWPSLERMEVSGIPLLVHEEFTNDVIYQNLYFDLRVLPQELVPYANLLSVMTGLLSTEAHTYGEINQLLNRNTGGFYTSLTSHLELFDDNRMLPHFFVSIKALNNRVDQMQELLMEILNTTRFDDLERIKMLLARHQAQLDASVKRAGNRYAGTRLSSYYSHQGMFREITEGLTYYWFVTSMVKEFELDPQKLISKLKEVATLLFNRTNLIVSTTCGAKDTKLMTPAIEKLVQSFSDNKPALNPWNFGRGEKNEAIATASTVQYVMMGYNFKELGFEWSGKMRVLNQVLSTDWLQSRIRVIGGAYGGYSSVTPSGIFTFNSYRDPNLGETLQNYRKTPEYLQNFEAGTLAMTRYIIGTISTLDHPLTPSQKGAQAMSHYFSGRTAEDIQRDRDAILGTTAADIRSFAPMIEAILNQECYCVYGNNEKILKEKDQFSSILTLEI